MTTNIQNKNGTISTLASLMGNARTLVIAAAVAGIFLIGGNQAGTAFAQPASDPLTLFTSNVLESWSNIAEENDFAHKAVLATGQAGALMRISEEFERDTFAPKVVAATGQADAIMQMAEENDWSVFAAKSVLATGQGSALMHMAEENDWPHRATKVSFGSGRTDIFQQMAEENDFGI